MGGMVWSNLQYLLGLARLGHDVWFVEQVPPRAIRPEGTPLTASVNARYFRALVRAFGLEGRAALLEGGSRTTEGVPYDVLREAARRADVLLNVSGMLSDDALIAEIPARVYLDLDPAFNQLWHAVSGIDMRLDGHTHFVTVGQSIGTGACAIPTCGREWIPTLQPVVLSEWPAGASVAHDAFTTVGNWRGYGSVEHDGVLYGQKAHAVRAIIDLPSLTRERLLLALRIHPDETADLEALSRCRWSLVDPDEVAGDPIRYRRFVQGSKGELGVAKTGYVVSRCGWFSDRSACYLASGRPVVAQRTGFERFLPTGEGLFVFDDAPGAAAATEEIARDYARHARAARAIAERHFDSARVLPRLLDRVHA
jgi:hypothetical protein